MPFKRLSILRITALCAMAGCVDLVYAVEGAYFVPAILSRGLSSRYGSMLISISPLVGIIVQSYLGSASDRCRCRWGKRRPFILMLAISCLAGLLLFPFTEDLAVLINETRAQDAFLIVLVVFSTFLVDFGAGSVQVPLKAYLLDALPPKQNELGNIIYIVCATIGAAVGFGIGAVPWSVIFTSSNDFSFQVKFVCIATFFIAILCTNLTLCSVKEQVTHQAALDVELCNLDENQRSAATQTDFHLPHFHKFMQYTSMEYVSNSSDNDFVSLKTECPCFSNFTNSLKSNLYFVKYMSLSMVILCASFFLIFVALYTQIYFFTSYVAEVVYEGDINAAENSTAYEDYIDGIAFGSFALGIAAIVGLIASLLLGPVIRLVGMRPVFVGSYVLLMLQSGILVATHNTLVTFILAPAIFVTLIVMLSIPFIIVSMYETTGLLLRKTQSHFASGENLIGRACAILIIALLGGQTFSLIVNGLLIEAYGSPVAVMILTCMTSFLGALLACFVTVPPKIKKKVKCQGDIKKVDISTQTNLE